MSSALVLALLTVAPPLPVGTEDWVLLTATGQVGSMKAVTSKSATGFTVEVELRIDDNGRGSKVTDHLETDARGVVLRRDIAGTRDSGAPVKEHYERSGAMARWENLDGKGEAPVGAEAFYVDADGTPWALGDAVRALGRAKASSLAALPGGTVTGRLLRQVDLGKPGAPDKVELWLVTTGLEPSQVLMRQGALVGVIESAGVLVERRHAGDFERLTQLAQATKAEVLAAEAKRLSHRLPDAPLWLTNARVFDSATGVVSAPQSVVVYRGQVTSLRADPPPPGALAVDCGGGTLLPGLFDAHAHQSALIGATELASGVTFVREPGNDNATLLDLNRRYDSGELLGPRVWKSGFLEGKSEFSAHNGILAGTLDEALAGVRWYAEHGYWGLKIYNSFKPEWVKATAAEAHRLGLHVSGHVPAFMTSEQAVRDGYDEVNHINQLLLGFLLKPGEDTRTPFRFTALGDRLADFDLESPAFQKMLALMKERRTAIDPTMAIFQGLLLGRPGTTNPADDGLLEHLPAAVVRGRTGALLAVTPQQDEVWKRSWKKLERVLVLLQQRGVLLVPGTDDGFGMALHSELITWVRAGLSPTVVLQAATRGGAQLLGQEATLGTIAVGRRADLYLVDGDPTQDITAIRKGRLVLKGEVAVYPDEVFEAFNIKPFAPHLTLPAAK